MLPPSFPFSLSSAPCACISRLHPAPLPHTCTLRLLLTPAPRTCTSHLPPQMRAAPRDFSPAPSKSRHGDSNPRSRRSRSRSPPPAGGKSSNKGRPRSPNPSHKKPHNSFQPGAGPAALSACTLCLGRHRHDTFHCNSELLWDNTAARCRRNDSGRLVNPDGLVLCSDWQLPRGCSSSGHLSRHECSGCGHKSHGAQNCPRSQKV